MRSVLVVLLGLAALVPTTGLPAQLTAKQILTKVSQTYGDLTSFRFVERVESSMATHSHLPYAGYCGPIGDCPARYEVDLAVSIPGKVRLVVSSRKGKIQVVSNGRKTWAYIPSLNEYMEAASAPLFQELWTYPHDHIGDDLYVDWVQLAHGAGGAKLHGEETLSLGGQNVRCYVMDVPAWLRVWVDEQRFIVLGTVGPGGATWSWQLTQADLGPIPDDVFQFSAPSGARRVDSFSAPVGPVQRGEEDLAGVLTGWKMWNDLEGEEYSLLGTGARDYPLGGLGGENVRLQSLHGKIVVLDFWASWCEPCQEELAAIQKLHDELASKGVVFLGVDDESPETIRAFVKEKGYTFPMLLDPKETLHELYGVRLVPTRVVIDRNGKIVDKYIGAGGEAQLRRALKSAGLNTTP